MNLESLLSKNGHGVGALAGDGDHVDPVAAEVDALYIARLYESGN
jgi:hypothetical protein